MTQPIRRSALLSLFQPFAKEAHLARERVRIEHTGGTHGAGYVCDVNEAAVAKYSDGSNSTTWIAFAEITGITITDRNGCALRSFTVTN